MLKTVLVWKVWRVQHLYNFVFPQKQLEKFEQSVQIQFYRRVICIVDHDTQKMVQDFHQVILFSDSLTFKCLFVMKLHPLYQTHAVISLWWCLIFGVFFFFLSWWWDFLIYNCGWGCRIHWLHLCRGGKTPPMSVLDMTLNGLMVRSQ